jgi:hypothetical protein
VLGSAPFAVFGSETQANDSSTVGTSLVGDAELATKVLFRGFTFAVNATQLSSKITCFNEVTDQHFSLSLGRILA